MRVGLVSDTHGLVDPALGPLLAGCSLILHAGDVVKPAVLEDLRRIAPVQAVRGNNDLLAPLDRLPEIAVVQLEALAALVIHDLGPRDRPHPAAQRALRHHAPRIVVHGHSHRPGHALVEGVFFINPGSAGPRRFSLPRTAALLEVRGRAARVAWFDLDGPGPSPFGDPVELQL